MDDLISRQAAINELSQRYIIMDSPHYIGYNAGLDEAERVIKELPPVQPETCEGCKHLGKWENEVEYGYPSPCTRCKRRVEDHYER